MFHIKQDTAIYKIKVNQLMRILLNTSRSTTRLIEKKEIAFNFQTNYNSLYDKKI